MPKLYKTLFTRAMGMGLVVLATTYSTAPLARTSHLGRNPDRIGVVRTMIGWASIAQPTSIKTHWLAKTKNSSEFQAIADEVGIDVADVDRVVTLAKQFAASEGSPVSSVETRTSHDPEEGFTYGAIRLMVDLPFEEAMELDWRMTSYIAERSAFPDRLSVAIRSA